MRSCAPCWSRMRSSSPSWAMMHLPASELPDGCELGDLSLRRRYALSIPLRREGSPDRALYQRVGRATTSQAHRALGRVDVDVHLAGTELEAQERRRVAALGKEVRVGPGDRGREGVRIHDPAVYRHVCVAPRREAHRERANESPHYRVIEGEEAARQREAVYLRYTLPQVRGGRQREDPAPLRAQGEPHPGAAERERLDDRGYGVGLSSLGT